MKSGRLDRTRATHRSDFFDRAIGSAGQFQSCSTHSSAIYQSSYATKSNVDRYTSEDRSQIERVLSSVKGAEKLRKFASIGDFSSFLKSNSIIGAKPEKPEQGLVHLRLSQTPPEQIDSHESQSSQLAIELRKELLRTELTELVPEDLSVPASEDREFFSQRNVNQQEFFPSKNEKPLAHKNRESSPSKIRGYKPSELREFSPPQNRNFLPHGDTEFSPPRNREFLPSKTRGLSPLDRPLPPKELHSIVEDLPSVKRPAASQVAKAPSCIRVKVHSLEPQSPRIPDSSRKLREKTKAFLLAVEVTRLRKIMRI